MTTLNPDFTPDRNRLQSKNHSVHKSVQDTCIATDDSYDGLYETVSR